ncbi:MAG: hypothetical protein MUC43_01130 [Pirellula sp.]|jgi:ABC-type transport system involved in multi-copper enzyme maturation permease subunit|nr:hypothetical protein [Pirellula sp.]
MIKTLIKKDLRLLKHFILTSIVVTLCCYIAAGVAVIRSPFEFTVMGDASTWSFLILNFGGNLGFLSAAFCAAILAGSVFTLERADRSVEFLACLPPRRFLHLVSKLSVVLTATLVMLAIHSAALIASNMLIPHVRSSTAPVSDGVSLQTLFLLVAAIVSVIGGALAISSWQKSNGVSILCGLLTPILLIKTIQAVEYFLEIPAASDGHSLRFAWTILISGLFLIFCGGYWYVERADP